MTTTVQIWPANHRLLLQIVGTGRNVIETIEPQSPMEYHYIYDDQVLSLREISMEETANVG